MIASMTVAVFIAAFVPIYDYFMKPRCGYGIVEFFTMEGRVENYLSQDSEVGSFEAVGKVDAHVVPLRVLSSDPPLLGSDSVSATFRIPRWVSISPANISRVTGTSCSPGVSLLLWETGFSEPASSWRCLGCCSSMRFTSVAATTSSRRSRLA